MRNMRKASKEHYSNKREIGLLLVQPEKIPQNTIGQEEKCNQ